MTGVDKLQEGTKVNAQVPGCASPRRVRPTKPQQAGGKTRKGK